MNLQAPAVRVGLVMLATVAMTGGVLASSASAANPSYIMPTPSSDPFYVPPANLAALANGAVIRTREVQSPEILGATDYQLLFRTNNSKGIPVATATTVFVPMSPSTGPRNLLSYQPATDSLGTSCQPSAQFQQGDQQDPSGVYDAVSNGWTAIVTDYQGPNMAWSAGRMAGQAVLDGIRAAESFVPAQVDSSSKVAGWGYSGGGQATGWAAQLQPSYAPELNVVGWVAGDFAADLKSLIAPGGTLDGTAFSGIEMTAVVGVARDYPELLPLFNEAGMQMAKGIKDDCQAQAFASNSFTRLSQFTKVNPLANKVALSVLADDSVGAQAPTAPTLLQSGTNDELIPPSQGTYANQVWCAKGGNIQLQRSAVPEHIVNDFATIPGSEQWLTDRYRGVPFNNTCSTTLGAAPVSTPFGQATPGGTPGSAPAAAAAGNGTGAPAATSASATKSLAFTGGLPYALPALGLVLAAGLLRRRRHGKDTR